MYIHVHAHVHVHDVCIEQHSMRLIGQYIDVHVVGRRCGVSIGYPWLPGCAAIVIVQLHPVHNAMPLLQLLLQVYTRTHTVVATDKV